MDETSQDRKRIGAFFAKYRRDRGLTLQQVSEKSGVSVPTLSKVETRGQISFDTLLRLIDALDLDVSDVLKSEGTRSNDGGRLTVTRANEAESFSSEQCDFLMHAGAIRGKQMIALIIHLKARDVTEYDRWSSHEGEEFVIVLEGTAVMHSEFYRPLTLHKGDSVYFDSSMAHAFVADGDTDATILSMCTGRGIKRVEQAGIDSFRQNGVVEGEFFF